jgi:hypothetical protein
MKAEPQWRLPFGTGPAIGKVHSPLLAFPFLSRENWYKIDRFFEKE